MIFVNLFIDYIIKSIVNLLNIYNNNNNQSLGISLDERKSRAYQVVHPM